MSSARRKILIVDDDASIGRLLSRLVGDQYQLAEAATGEEALEILPHFGPDLVMLDIMMPGIDGHETCRRIRSGPLGDAIQVMMVTASSSRTEQIRAYAAGADDYVVKPFDPQELCSRIKLHFRLRGAVDMLGAAGDCSVETFRGLLSNVHDATVAALTKVAEFRDAETGEHLVRMRSYAQILGEELACHGPYQNQVDEKFLDDLFRASPLHDIGKIGISDVILRKPRPLSEDDSSMMRQHTTIGANILESVAFNAPGATFLGMAATVARFHHERFDGTGYPAGLIGLETPLPARIVAVADAFDAITSTRPYKESQSPDVAREIICRDSGSHFDPAIVDAFLRRFDALVRVQRQTRAQIPLVIGAQSPQLQQLVAIVQM